MAKTKRNKKDRKLRQSIEILKAQLKVEEPEKTVKEVSPQKKVSGVYVTDDKAIKADLTKTLALSGIAFAILIALMILNIRAF